MKQKTLYQRKTNKIKDIFDNIKQSHIIINKNIISSNDFNSNLIIKILLFKGFLFFIYF